MERAGTVLRGLTVAALVAGAALLSWPIDASVAPLGDALGASAVAAGPAPVAGTDSLVEDIILYDAFARSRTPPDRRYAGPGTEVDADAGPSVPAATATEAPILLGTVVSDRAAGSMAMLQAGATDRAPRLYAVGERVGSYRVESVEARSVVLTGPRGRVVLRLPQEERP